MGKAKGVGSSGNQMTFGSILFGLLRNFAKFPAIIRSLRETKALSSDTKLSLGTYLEKNADLYPDSCAIRFEDVSYTHREFNTQVNRYANYLLSLGLKKGEAVTAFLEPSGNTFPDRCGRQDRCHRIPGQSPPPGSISGPQPNGDPLPDLHHRRRAGRGL